MNNTQNDLRLLPTGFKKVGLAILLLSVLLIALSISKILLIDKEVVKTISKSGVLISLLLFAITRNKLEDELTIRIRLKAFAGTFIYAVIVVIIDPFVNLLFDGIPLANKDATELLFSMFFFYFLMLFLMKRNRK